MKLDVPGNRSGEVVKIAAATDGKRNLVFQLARCCTHSAILDVRPYVRSHRGRLTIIQNARKNLLAEDTLQNGPCVNSSAACQ
jgi:hypothetical protein